jgi:glycyl-tRNA synthetase beta subunit
MPKQAKKKKSKQPLSVAPGKRVRLADFDPGYTGGLDKKDAKAEFEENTAALADLGYRLYAENRRALLMVLQGMDTSGKDGTIRHVMRGFNPQSCQVVSFEYAGLRASNITRGLRFHQPEEKAISSPQEYFDFLASQGILLDNDRRRSAIQEQVARLSAEVNCVVLEDSALQAEVTNLVEAPTALRGSFDPQHLKLPQEVLISVMKKHQRYFPVLSAGAAENNPSGQNLLPYFIAVRNGDGKWLDIVTDGNEHVIRARFADADFFVSEDLKRPLEAYLPRLDTLTFQVKLGSMLDKTRRI